MESSYENSKITGEINMSAEYDIVLQTCEDLEGLERFLLNLAEMVTSESFKVIIWNRHNQEQMLIKWQERFDSFTICDVGNTKLSKLVQNDMVLVDSRLCFKENWLHNLKIFAYKTPETGVVNPLIVKADGDVDDSRVNTEEIRLHEHLWTNLCGTSCLFVKRDIVAALENYDLQDLFSPTWGEQMKQITSQLGYRQELCDTVILKSHALSTDLESDYGYPEVLDNIRLHSDFVSDKQNLLFVVQADFSGDASNNIGGTQLHVKDIVYGIKDKYHVFVAARDGDFLRVTAYLENMQKLFRFYIGSQTEKPIFYDEAQRKLFRTILNAFSIDLVHVHHTYGFSTEIYEEAAQLNIPIILTLHDFYFLCPTIKMFDYKNMCCIGTDNKERCRQCLSKLMGITDNIDYITHWRQQTYRILQLCNKVIVPSENAKQIFSQYFPKMADSIQVIEHGYDVPKKLTMELVTTPCVKENIEVINQDGQCTEIRGWAFYDGVNNNAGKIYLDVTDNTGQAVRIPTYKMERGDVAQGNSYNLKTGFQAFVPNNGLERGNLKIRVIVTSEGQHYSSGKVYDLKNIVTKNTDNLRVAFIGGLSVAKGSRQIYDIIQRNIVGVDWYIFGGIDDEHLQKLKKKNLTWTNFYHRDDLSAYLDLHKIDVIVILSLWPETFCYTLSEAVAYKRPVIVTGVGALGDRTKAMNCGWVVPLNSIEQSVIDILEGLKEKPDEYKKKCEIVNDLKLRSLLQMNEEYLALYKSMKVVKRKKIAYDAKQIYDAWDGKILGKEERVISAQEYQNYILSLEQNIQQIYTSRSYKLATKISKVWSRMKGRGIS